MRLWGLHPKYLDTKGLVALWREALLAREVLKGKTKGWRKHPQLDRFRAHPDPVAAVNSYLLYVWEEGDRRGYSFNKRKLGKKFSDRKLRTTRAYFARELEDLKSKLRKRSPADFRKLLKVKKVEPHPFFVVGK